MIKQEDNQEQENILSLQNDCLPYRFSLRGKKSRKPKSSVPEPKIGVFALVLIILTLACTSSLGHSARDL